MWTIEDWEDFFFNTKKRLKRESKWKLAFAACMIVAILYIFLGFGYSREELKKIEKEITLAKKLCEEAEEWVQGHIKRLKMGETDLRSVPVKGEPVTLEYVAYPVIIFYDTGIRSLTFGRETDLACTFSDPRSSDVDYVFNYETHLWTDHSRFDR